MKVPTASGRSSEPSIKDRGATDDYRDGEPAKVYVYVRVADILCSF
jgi:hypothetical protein